MDQDRELPQPEGQAYAGGGGGRSADGMASHGGSNPLQDPFTTGGEAALRHDAEVRARSPGAGESIPAGGRDGATQPPGSVVGQRQRAVEDAVQAGTGETNDGAAHNGFTGEANEAEARSRAGLPPTD